jgi:DNA-binding CsgD family transcriptional regulator
VGEVLYEVAMTLGRGSGAVPHHLSAYVAGACRLRTRAARVAESKYRDRIADALESFPQSAGLPESVVASLCSEYSLRDARGPEWEPPTLAPVLERLLGSLEEQITHDERRMLRLLGDQVSYTAIAERLGITRPAAVSRIQRLRARLIEAAFRFGAALDLSDRAELIRFLRRAGVLAKHGGAPLARVMLLPNDEEEDER